MWPGGTQQRQRSLEPAICKGWVNLLVTTVLVMNLVVSVRDPSEYLSAGKELAWCLNR
jgi:hypothetical protein